MDMIVYCGLADLLECIQTAVSSDLGLRIWSHSFPDGGDSMLTNDALLTIAVAQSDQALGSKLT